MQCLPAPNGGGAALTRAVSGRLCSRNFACNSLVGFSIFEVETLKSCGFWGVVVYGRQGIACGIGECGDGGAALAAGSR